MKQAYLDIISQSKKEKREKERRVSSLFEGFSDSLGRIQEKTIAKASRARRENRQKNRKKT
jgi:hypothetical protein